MTADAGLREALTALADQLNSRSNPDQARESVKIRRAVAAQVRAVLAAHPAPTADETVSVDSMRGNPAPCTSVLNINGEHFPCRQMEQMREGSDDHNGWAHSNPDAEAIWSDAAAPPVTVTDAALERAARALAATRNGDKHWSTESESYRVAWREKAQRTLTDYAVVVAALTEDGAE